MTKILRISMALALTLSSTPAWATLEQEIDLKIQQRTQKTFNGAPSAIPTEYGEIPNGLVLEKYTLEFENEKYMVDVEAENIKQNNQTIKAEGGQPGKMTWKVSWDNMAHLFSNEARSPYVYQGGGIMSLTSGNRLNNTPLQSYSTYYTPVFAAGAVPYVQFGYQVETGNVDLKFHPGDDLVVELGGMRQTKKGTKGTTGAFGFSNAIELAAPIDWVTTEGYVDLQYAKKDYQIGFNYRASEFKNNIPNLYWDNPYRSSDQYDNSSGYSLGNQSKNGGQAMDPNNKAWAAKLEGGVNLPMNSRFSGELGYQRWSANNEMMFYTTNSSMKPGGATGSATGSVPAFDASRTRPADNVDSKMDILTYMGKLTTRPFHWLRASLAHDAYILQDRGVKYTLPGWGVFDQVWHAETKTTPTENVRDDKTSLKVDYDVTSWMSGNVGLMHTYKKVTREVSKAREYQTDLGFSLKPSKDLFVNLAYQLQLRRGNGMDFQNYPRTTAGTRQYFADAPGMRRPDVADKNRNQGRVQVQWTPGEASYSLSARMSEDKYRQGKGDLNGGDLFVFPELFGILSNRQVAIGADVSVPVGESLIVDAYAEYENSRQILRSNQTQNANTCGGTGTTAIMCQDPRYRWTTRMTDNTNIAGLMLTWLTTAKLKTVFGYDLVSTRFNGDPIETGSLITNYRPLETSRRFQQTLKARGEYKVMKDLTFVANYMYEKFDATDFAYKSVPTRTPDNASLFLGASPIRNYYAHTVSGGIKYRF